MKNFNGLILGLVIGFGFMLGSASVSFAAPAVTGVSGTLSNGQSLTITGSGFGANGCYQENRL